MTAATPGAAAATPAARVDTPTWLALAALTALGAALRLHGLAFQSLWNDELSGVAEYTLPGWLALIGPRTPPDHMPGYWLLMYVWTRGIGDSEALLRLPSALFGIATIPAMFALGRRWYGRAEGLIAAAIVTVTWMPVWYSQEARPYAWLLLGVVSSTALVTDLVSALRRDAAPGIGTMAGCIIALSATVYAHYFGVMMVLLQAATAVMLLRRKPRALARLAGLYAAVALVSIPCLAHAWLSHPRGPDWLRMPQPVAFWNLLRFYFNQSDGVVWLVLLVWAAALLRLLAQRARPAPQTLLLVAWLVSLPVFVYAYSHLLATPRFLERTLIVCAPPAYLLLARALTRLPLARVTAPALIGLLLVQLIGSLQFYSLPVKEQFREATTYVVTHTEPNASPRVFGCAGHTYFDYYFSHLGSPLRAPRVAKPEEVAAAQALIVEQQPRDVWVLEAHRVCDPALLATLQSQMTLVDHQQFVDAKVWRFQRP